MNKFYIFWICDYNLLLPVTIAHNPYCFLWPVLSFYFIVHNLINITFFRKIFIEPELHVFSLSMKISENFSILSRLEREIIKNIYFSSCKISVCIIFKETITLSTAFQRIYLHKFSWISFRLETICCQEQRERQTDGQRNVLISNSLIAIFWMR